MSGSRVYLELVAGRADALDLSSWRVEPGLPTRGRASCDFARRVLTVPLGMTATERVVRAHELAHLRVSPHDFAGHAGLDLSARSLECAEEFRVNTLLRRLNFDVALLRDGSERRSGELVASADDWAEAVYFFVAVYQTGAAADYLKGLRVARPEWVKALRSLGKEIDAVTNAISTVQLASTERTNPETLPEGYDLLTTRVARLADRAAGASAPETPEEQKLFRRSLSPGGRRAPSGRFAPLVLDETVTYQRAPGAGRRPRPRASATGVVVRRPHRLLTDPQQRIFVQRQRRHGGIVLVDQSGSMDLQESDLDAVLQRARGVTVLGYSHRPGDVVGTPNAWILADRGQRAEQLRTGNVGNGVDGPVLEWALRRRRPGELVVWVTDGQVTDSNDHPNETLTAACADLVRRHQIRLVRRLDEAVGLLGGATTSPPDYENFGRLGRALEQRR